MEVYTNMYSTRMKSKAVANNVYRKEHFATEIQRSCEGVVIYGGYSEGKYDIDNYDVGSPRDNLAKVDIVMNDIKSYLLNDVMKLEGRTAVLNFASYKNPGGKYINGSMAQEEAICHCTTLYEVLQRQTDYYEWNCNHKNKGMYLDRLLYSPDILILDDSNKEVGHVDVMTCAAPNMSVGLRYETFTKKRCQYVFYNRMNFMIRIAAHNKVDNLILGAWGCGVFENDPEFVARSLFKLHNMYRNYFSNIVYVIPKGDNYYTFLRVAAIS